MHESINLIAERALDMKILHTQQTMPNILTVKNWKADQLKFGLLYLIIPLLHGFLDEKYMVHICKFQRAVTILMKNEISSEEVVLARKLLLECAVEIPTEWHQLLASIDLHRAIHLPMDTENFGNANKREGFHDEVSVYLTTCGK